MNRSGAEKVWPKRRRNDYHVTPKIQVCPELIFYLNLIFSINSKFDLKLKWSNTNALGFTSLPLNCGIAYLSRFDLPSLWSSLRPA